MGSGISLSEQHIADIIKRDLDIQHKKHMSNLPPCIPQYETLRNYIENESYRGKLNHIDRLTERLTNNKVNI